LALFFARTAILLALWAATAEQDNRHAEEKGAPIQPEQQTIHRPYEAGPLVFQLSWYLSVINHKPSAPLTAFIHPSQHHIRSTSMGKKSRKPKSTTLRFNPQKDAYDECRLCGKHGLPGLSHWDQHPKELMICCGFYLCRFCAAEAGFVKGDDKQFPTGNSFTCPVCHSSITTSISQALDTLAMAGHAEAQYICGEIARNSTEGPLAFYHAAENGNERGRAALADYYLLGKAGVHKNVKEALRLCYSRPGSLLQAFYIRFRKGQGVFFVGRRRRTSRSNGRLWEDSLWRVQVFRSPCFVQKGSCTRTSIASKKLRL
jgi:hypothetical protein